MADQLGVAVIFPRGLNNGPGRGWAFPGCNSVPNIGVTDVECDRTATCGPVGYAAGCRLSGCPSQAAFNENNGCGPQFTANATCLDPATNCNWCGCTWNPSHSCAQSYARCGRSWLLHPPPPPSPLRRRRPRVYPRCHEARNGSDLRRSGQGLSHGHVAGRDDGVVAFGTSG